MRVAPTQAFSAIQKDSVRASTASGFSKYLMSESINTISALLHSTPPPLLQAHTKINVCTMHSKVMGEKQKIKNPRLVYS